QKQRILRRPNVKGHVPQFGPLRVRNIHVRLDRTTYALLLDVLHHPHDLDVRLDLTAAKRKMCAERIPPWEEALYHRFARDSYFGSRCAIRLGKFAARKQWNSQGRE